MCSTLPPPISPPLLNLLYLIYLCTMTKKGLVFLLLTMYAMASMGVTIRAHYCCGRLHSVEIISDRAASCGCKEKQTDAPRKCCKDKTAVYKVTADQKVTTSHQPVSKLYPTLVTTAWRSITAPIGLIRTAILAATQSPILVRALGILGCVWRL
jgi:hypothetical protein